MVLHADYTAISSILADFCVNYSVGCALINGYIVFQICTLDKILGYYKFCVYIG